MTSKFEPACLSVQSVTHSSKTSKLEVNLPRGQYWPSGCETALKEETLVILQAIDDAFALDAEGNPTHKLDPSKEVIIYRTAVDLCAMGYAPQLTEKVVEKLKDVISNCARSLLVRARSTSERIKVAAEAWNHFVNATGFVRRTLLYPDQTYVRKTALKSWTHVCVARYKSCLEGNNFNLVGYLIAEMSERLSRRRQADAAVVAASGSVPTEGEPWDPDVRSIVHMLLDLDWYDTKLEPVLLEGVNTDCSLAIEKILNSNFSRVRQSSVLLTTFLLREYVRIAASFNAHTAPKVLKVIVTNVISGHLDIFFGPASQEAIQFSAETPVQIVPTSGLIELTLRREDSLLRVVFLASLLMGHMDQFCDVWADGVKHMTIRCIDHFFPDGSNTQLSEVEKVDVFSSFVVLSERLNWISATVFDCELKTPKGELEVPQTTEEYVAAAQTLLMTLRLTGDAAKDRSDALQKRAREAFGAALAAKPEGARVLSACLIQFVDQLLRGRKAMGAPGDEQPIKAMLRCVIGVLRSIEWKNLIKTMHEEGMTLRLFAGQGKHHELERYFVSLLAEECGDWFTQDMQTILSEFNASNQITADFHEQAEPTECSFGVNVVPAQVWKSGGAANSNSPGQMGDATASRALVSYDVEVPLPEPVIHFHTQFALFYKKKFENRLLKYALQDSRAQLKMQAADKSAGPPFYLLTTTALQAVLLLKFNDKSTYTINELAHQCHIDAERVTQELNPFKSDPAKAILLAPKPNSFKLNPNFTYSRTKITFRGTGGHNPLGDNDVREPKVFERASQLSTAAIDAFIVRHMKMQKEDTFTNIFAGLAEARLGAPLESSDVRERLTLLVDKGELLCPAVNFFLRLSQRRRLRPQPLPVPKLGRVLPIPLPSRPFCVCPIRLEMFRHRSI